MKERCRACNTQMTDKDFQLDDEFCRICFKSYLDALDEV